MNGEVWKEIPQALGHFVSSMGRVKSPNVIYQAWMLNTGYLQIKIRRKAYSVHRLVAQAFCDGYFNGAVVNHKNGVRDDNRASNLEWVTHSDNLKHGFRVLGAKKPYEGKFSKDHSTSKAVVSTNLKTGEETFYWCALDAVRAGDFDSGGISRCCHGIWKFHKGHYWRFATDDECERMAESVEVAACPTSLGSAA